MMTIESGMTVRELVVKMPAATRVLERWGIDYCCGGGRSLEEACGVAGAKLEAVVESLSRAEPAQDPMIDWRDESLSRLIGYIIGRHHTYAQQEMRRLDMLGAKVASVHGANHPELAEVATLIRELGREIGDHMRKEEQVVFPQIRAIEKPATMQPQAAPAIGAGIGELSSEHEVVGDLLRRLRAVTSNYRVPADGCTSYRTLYQALDEFERDLHEHIHLENNILFPRALALHGTEESPIILPL